MGDGGDGVTARGVFVPFALPGEEVRATVAEGRGALVEVLRESPERAVPPCPHFGRCGGCALQHWRAAPYLEWKSDRIRRALARVGLEPRILPPAPVAAGSRRRLALHARRTAKGEAALGFKVRRSHALAPIAVCPVARPEIEAALPVLAKVAAPLLEHPLSAPTLHVTATLQGLDVEVSGIERKSGGLSADRRQAAAEAAARADLARLTLAGEILYQARAPEVLIGGIRVPLPPGAFLQACAASEASLAAFVEERIPAGWPVADLFCGIGTFALRLATSRPVIAFDQSPAAVAALMSAARRAPGLRPLAGRARDLERAALTPAELGKVRAVVFDPPRAGAARQARAIADSKAERVLSVSCNPVTFARDASILAAGGMRLVEVLPVDQFLWSAQIELVGFFERA